MIVSTEALEIQWHSNGASLAQDHQHARTGIASHEDVMRAMRREFPGGFARLSETEQRIAESMAVQGYDAMHRRLARADTVEGGNLVTRLHPTAEERATERQLARVFRPLGERVFLANDRRVHATLRMPDGDTLVVFERPPLLAVLARLPSALPVAERSTDALAGQLVMLHGSEIVVAATPVRGMPDASDGAARVFGHFARTTGRPVRLMGTTGAHVTLVADEGSFTLRLDEALAALHDLPAADPGLSRGMSAEALQFSGVVAALASHNAIVTMSF